MVENWGAYLKQRRAKRKLELEALPKVPCACGCGTLICPEDAQGRPIRYAYRHFVPRKGKRFSTDEQKAQVRQRAGEKFRNKLQAEIDAMPKIPCACGCGKLIAPMGLDKRPRKYAFGHGSVSGAEHFYWKGGVSFHPYPQEFSKKLKNLIRERDNYTCQSCGITEGDNGQKLQVHHMDGNKFHNDPANLVTVCGSCNLWYRDRHDPPFVVMGRKP